MTLTKENDLTRMSNHELRRLWDYGRNDERSDLAKAVLSSRGQIAPDGKPFAWGTILAHHTLGDICIVESWRDHPVWHRGEELAPDENDVGFHPYIDGKDTNHGYPSLELAAVGAIAIKHDGINTRADTYFARAIGLARKEEGE